MRIAFFMENIQVGGLDTFVINLLNNWKKDELTLICNPTHPGLDLLKGKLNKDVKLLEHNIPLTWDLKYHYPDLPTAFYGLLKFLYFIVDIPIQVYLLKRFFMKYEFDKLMVINGGYPGGDSCLSATIAWGKLYPNNKAWHNFHNLALSYADYSGIDKLKYFRSILIDKVLRKYVKGFISVSRNSINTLNKRNSFQNSKKTYIYNGISLNENLDNEISIKEKYRLDKKSKVIVMLGSYEKRKGQDFLIKVFLEVNKRYKNVYLFMFGDGNKNYIEYLQKLKEENENIFIEDYIDVGHILKDVNILAIPSQSFESFGYTAVEAMVMKIPVVATNIGGLPEVVADGVSGYVIEHDDYEDFTEKFLFLLNHEDICVKFGVNGYNRYNKKFKANLMVKEYRKLISKWT